jgi:MoaA/NifB/PqqE/SkfB family radical SAM enzyme
MDNTKEAMYVQLLDFNVAKRKEWVDNRKPYSVLFELTARCNFNCIHCYLQNNHASEQMPFEKVIEIIDVLHDKGILFLTFTGGEIFTRADFLEIYC